MGFYLVFVFLAYSLQGLNAAPPVEVTPERIILLENRPLEVKCRVGVPITYCRFAVPGVPQALSLRPGIPPHLGIQYIGAGLDKGDCGMLIQSVSSKNSGTIQCSMAFLNEPTESTGNSTLIVAKPPDPPLLRVYPGNTYPDSFREGEMIQANCRISNARPIANISWYLGSEPIYDRLGPVVTEEENGLWTISQNMTRRVSYVDHGKDLKCVAGHIALGQGNINHSIYKLNILFPPKPKSQELEKFGFTIGQPGKIVVTFQANPIPNIVWKVDQDNLQPGARDRNGRYEAGVLQHKGAGTWDAVLNINNVRAEEVEKRYTLVAQNELGHESYKVAISTSPEPPADITAGAIVGIVIAVLIILLLVFLLIFARATGRWCFAGGVPRPPGESLLPYRRSYLSNRNPAKVHSLIYKDYTLVECEDGSKLYVSPEEKARLVLEGQIKSSKVSLETDRVQKRLHEPESGSETEYETPVTPGSKPSTRTSVEDPDKILVVKANVNRNSSFPFSDLETSPGDNGRINLPPYIVPVETSLTLPMIIPYRKKDKRKKKKKAGSEGEEDRETDSDELFNPLTSSQENGLSSTKDGDDGEGRWRLGLKRSKPFSWVSRDRRKANEEMDDSESPESPTEIERTPTPKEESKTLKKRFSFPWGKDKSVDNGNEEDKQQDTTPTDDSKPDEPDNGRSSKRFSIKLPRLSWKKGKKGGRDKEPEVGDDEDKTEEPKEDHDEKYTYENDLSREESKDDLEPEPEMETRPEKQADLFSLIQNQREFVGDLEEPEEVFPEPSPTPKKSYSIRFPKVFPVKLDKGEEQGPREGDLESPKLVADVERNSQGFAFPQYPPKEVAPYRRDRNKVRVDANPLKGMFKVRRPKANPDEEVGSSRETLDQSQGSEGEGGQVEETKSSRDTLNSADDRPSILPDITWYRARVPEDTTRYFSLDRGSWYSGGGDNGEPEVSPQSHKLFQKLTDSGFLVEAPPKDAGQPDCETASSGSDTESADHGSTDKSSVSKLTSDKQPKKLMSGLFGSLKMGKNKDKVSDNDTTRNLSSFEITVKEQPEEVVQVDGTRTDGIVYAELDMARSPNSVMRRDDDKTEYAEIIYPGTKIPAVERTMDEFRKSRENLASSRENLTEVDEAFTTTMTPDGKKEAAV